MVLSLLFFIAGSTLGAYHLNFWMEETPTLPAISLATSTGLGYFGAWAIQIVLFAVIYWITIESRKRKTLR